jgi:hypothetical protein
VIVNVGVLDFLGTELFRASARREVVQLPR